MHRSTSGGLTYAALRGMSEHDYEGEERPKKQAFELVLGPEHLTGVWANFARVSQTIHEFTLDFARLDPTTSKGIVVARVSVSPLFVKQLIDVLGQEWTKYERRAFPLEIYRDEGTEPKDGQEGEPEPPSPMGTTTEENPPSKESQRTIGEPLAAELRRQDSSPERPR
jgi:hypothetical protein